MPSNVGICNMALANLMVDQRIEDLSDPDDPQALTCAVFFQQAREETLVAHDWSFAERRVVLAEVTGTAPLPWTYQYRYPTDCLKIRSLDPEVVVTHEAHRLAFEVTSDDDGRLILTDTADAILIYTVALEDPVRFPAEFVAAFAWKLAAYLAGPVGKSTAVRDSAEQRFLLATQRAVSADMAQQQDRDHGGASDFLQARS